jgi:hypothetical protein
MLVTRKFKLIKIYPGSRELGTIVTNENTFAEYYLAYPEFWEEVIELPRDFEILSFKDTRNHNIMTKRSHGRFILEGLKENEIQGASEEYELKQSDYVIHSVKRLSDNKVFTLGDKINNGQEIKSIGLINEEIRIYPQHSFYKIKEVMLDAPPILFWTEDDVPIHKREYSYIVDIDYIYQGSIMWDTTECFTKDSVNPRYRFFSTEAKAKEYIIMNKPVLSLKDIEELSYTVATNKVYCVVKDLLINKVKNKIWGT